MQQERIKFTRTEQQIIDIIKADTTIKNPEIASEMVMMVSSVGQYLRSIYKKLGVFHLPKYEKREYLNQWIKENM